jgi:hypothetical protein
LAANLFAKKVDNMQKLLAGEVEHRTVIIKLVNECRIISVQLFLLLLGLYINRKIVHFGPTIWILIPIFIAAALVRANFSDGEKLVVRLWQLIALLSAIYSLLHYPLMPLAHDNIFTVSLFISLLLAWGISIISGVFCFWIPSLSILPPAFLLWSNFMAGIITDLPTTIYIDVQPLTEVSVCIGLGLLINQAYLRWGRNIWGAGKKKACSGAVNLVVNDAFANLLLLIAISVHLANYFWSFYKKISLDGPWGAWLTENNPAYLFLTALDDGHVIFSGYPRVVQWAYGFFDAVHIYSNFWVLVCQAAAIIAFFLPKRAFFILLLMFDAMHASIIFIGGINFWPWIILNIIIAVIVVSPYLPRQPAVFRLIATGFILIAPHFVQVTMLGWFDSGANNKLYFEAVDESGKRYAVPTNFFTFYSYSFGHMDYGPPDPASAFATGEPNGGTWEYHLFRAGRNCDVAALTRPGSYHSFDRQRLPAFVQNYHRLALMIYSKIGAFPYDFYPHHFYVPFSESREFDGLDKRRVVAYIYRQESVCLSFDAGTLQRKVMATAEYEIDVRGSNRDGRSRN